ALARDAQPNIPGNQEILIIFSTGNDGPDSTSTTSPANAKNIISVGAAENYRPTWRDGCGFGPTSADNANDIATFSSRGPTRDGRNKPDLVAPGTHIQGAASQGTYTGDAVCDSYQPAGQTLYAASSGTSHAAPAIAGAASLATRHYQEKIGTAAPSPAMLKAYLINSTRYLNGEGAGDTLPSYSQGFGEVDLGLAFDETARLILDQTHIFHATGEVFTLSGTVADPAYPFRVTLVWMDAPGATFGAAYVNNLDLAVQVNGQTYLGNVFSGASSIPDGVSDPRNNVESVFLPAGSSGTFSLTITATNLAGDGIPGNGDPTDQDFALICYNCAPNTDFALHVAPPTQTICAGDHATFTLTTHGVNGFAHPITLESSGTPDSASLTIQPNPLTPGESAQVILAPTDGVLAGSYPLTITGSAANSTHATHATLDVYTPVIAGVTRLTPHDGQVVPTAWPTLVWQGFPNVQQYDLSVAVTADFAAPLYTITIPAAGNIVSHTLALPLNYATDYYWRVTARNACGAGPDSAPGRFHTPQPPAEFCSEPYAAIPDNYAPGVNDSLLLPDFDALRDLNVAISITHNFVGDLVVILEHVNTGITTTLLARPGSTVSNMVGCPGDDMDILLDDSAAQSVGEACRAETPAYPPGGVYRPQEPLSVFNGVNFSGTWRLHVADHAGGDTGVLNHWCLIPTTHDPAFTFAQPIHTVWKDAGAAAIAVNLHPPADITATVTYATHDLTALAGRDYLSAGGTLTFAPGVTTQVFTVPILNDPTNTHSRTARLNLERPVSATFVLPQQAILAIVAPHRVYLPITLRNWKCTGTICLPR
ncbi:MAG TPA: S8 family serine peptidase, partial [Anaerolineae bacterium]|nr:S8 family serine peptidase [Anaerolineae bacterium]